MRGTSSVTCSIKKPDQRQHRSHRQSNHPFKLFQRCLVHSPSSPLPLPRSHPAPRRSRAARRKRVCALFQVRRLGLVGSSQTRKIFLVWRAKMIILNQSAHLVICRNALAESCRGTFYSMYVSFCMFLFLI